MWRPVAALGGAADSQQSLEQPGRVASSDKRLRGAKKVDDHQDVVAELLVHLPGPMYQDRPEQG